MAHSHQCALMCEQAFAFSTSCVKTVCLVIHLQSYSEKSTVSMFYMSKHEKNPKYLKDNAQKPEVRRWK